MAVMPTLFISHGGGPWPYVEEMRKQFTHTAAWLAALPATLPSQPKAILSISGHWEEREFTVATALQPPMVFDYSGFPEHTYHISYPAPGSPALAMQVKELLAAAKIACREDSMRGLDHGTFVPLALMYPDAHIPVVSLSIKKGYDPLAHIKLGEALAPLRHEGVLIIGSGLSYHNLRLFGPEGSPAAKAFEAWLTATVTAPSQAARVERLLNWEHAPSARLAHPREDHLLPLMVNVGAAGDDRGRRVLLDKVWGITMASYQFG